MRLNDSQLSRQVFIFVDCEMLFSLSTEDGVFLIVVNYFVYLSVRQIKQRKGGGLIPVNLRRVTELRRRRRRSPGTDGGTGSGVSCLVCVRRDDVKLILR